MQQTKRILIVVMNAEGLIGSHGKLPWHLPNDLAYFKQSTLNQTIIMGRKTFESIGRVLPKRHHIVLSSQVIKKPSITHAFSLQSAFELCPKNKTIFIIGGASLYAQALPLVDELWITEVDCPEAQGDVYFPPWDKQQWQCRSHLECKKDKKNPFNHAFVQYTKNMAVT